MNGRLRLGVGVGHGWQNLGVYFTATRTRDVWVQTLDNAPAAEMYGKYFGYTAREWAFPPLSDMARLYPLGVEPLRNKNTGPFMPTAPGQILIRSALRVEVDGSLRMSGPVPQGSVVNLMAGDPEACLKAAGSAAAAALAQLAGARPLMALVLIDAAWLILFESRPSQLATALNEALGDIPWIGAYTYSQLHRPDLSQPPVLHNQTLEVIAFGEAERG